MNRFGKRQTIYATTLKEIRQKLRDEEYEDEKCVNVVRKDMTLNEWYVIWMDTCKKNCRASTKETYAKHYLRILIKNVAKQINTIIDKGEKKERRVLTKKETEIFLSQSEDTFYYNLYVVALETGLRIGELMGLQWSDIDFNKKVMRVRRSLCYFSREGKYIFEWHDTKTHNSKRTIPLTSKAFTALKQQKVARQTIFLKHANDAIDEYRDLVFVTRNNRPTQQFIVQECIDVTIRRIQKEYSEFERFSPHCFRHTFATRAIENGMQPKTLQKLLGHGSLQMTMDLYCHVTEDTLFEAMELMECAM